MKKTYLLGIFTMLLSHAFAFDYNTSNPSYDEYNTIYFTETGVSGSNIKSIEIDDVDKYKMTVVFVDDTEYLIQLSNDKEFDLQGRFDKTNQLYISKRTGTNCDKKEWSNYKITFSEVEENHIIKHPYHFYNTQCNSGSRSIGTLESRDVISKSGNPKWLNNSYHLYFYSNNNTTATTKPFNISSIELERLGEVIVNIPDAAFKIALLNHDPKIDTNNDGDISVTEAESVTGKIDVRHSVISDLTGIEAFVNLTELNCYNNDLTNIDLSNNKAIEQLDCGHNQLSGLDLSNNIALKYLYCNQNQLTNLNVSNNNALVQLQCDKNQLTSIDVSNNIALEYLSLDENQLFYVDVSNNKDLNSLFVDKNLLTSIDVTHNTVLKSLMFSYNQLTSIDVSNNSLLEVLNFSFNQLKNVDVSKNNALVQLGCDKNQLTSLDVSNNLELKYLLCRQNQLINLDVTNNIALEWLGCGGNQLTSLDVTNNTLIKQFYCTNTSITSLDLSKNSELLLLLCHSNQFLTSLDISNGNNSNFWYFNIVNSPNLSCITVDNQTESHSWQKQQSVFYTDEETNITYYTFDWDAQVEFSEDCSALSNQEVTDYIFKVYPIPANNFITVDSTLDGKYNLVSMLGKTIAKGTLRQGDNTIDLSNFNKGIYFLNVTSNRGSETIKIIKE